MCVGLQREAGLAELHQDGLADDAGLAAAAEAAEDDGEAVGGRGLVGRGRAGGSTGAETAAGPQPPRRQRDHTDPHAVPRHPAPLRLLGLAPRPRPRPRPGLRLVAVEVVVADDVVGTKNKNNVNTSQIIPSLTIPSRY